MTNTGVFSTERVRTGAFECWKRREPRRSSSDCRGMLRIGRVALGTEILLLFLTFPFRDPSSVSGRQAGSTSQPEPSSAIPVRAGFGNCAAPLELPLPRSPTASGSFADLPLHKSCDTFRTLSSTMREMRRDRVLWPHSVRSVANEFQSRVRFGRPFAEENENDANYDPAPIPEPPRSSGFGWVRFEGLPANATVRTIRRRRIRAAKSVKIRLFQVTWGAAKIRNPQKRSRIHSQHVSRNVKDYIR